MSFLHVSLIAGLATITVPIMLHLFGQRQPQVIDFPALRFVRQTRLEQNSSWQLRHILLLLLRIFLLALLALALARPRVHSVVIGSLFGIVGVAVIAVLATLATAVALVTRRPASVWLTTLIVALGLWLTAGAWGVQTLTSGPTVPSSDSSAPVAAAMIIDNGPTLAYQSGNRTRLEAAQGMANWILDQLPIDSRVGVLTSAPIGTLALDPATARGQVKLIEQQSTSVNLTSRIRTAVELVMASGLQRKEVYVVTDLCPAAWEQAQSDLVETLQDVRQEVLLQIIDVGQNEVVNWRLGDPEHDFSSLPADGTVTFDVDVHHVRLPNTTETGSGGGSGGASVAIELLQEQLDPRLPVVVNDMLKTPPAQVVDRKLIDVEDNSTHRVQLTSRSLPTGTHHFTIQLDRSDPLPLDNRRFASVVARQQQPALIVADDPQLGLQLQLILDPSRSRDATGQPIVQRVRATQLSQVEVEKYELICLFDPPPLSSRVAQRLDEHVRGGGGLLIILGPELGDPQRVRENPIADLFPGQLAEVRVRSSGERDVFLDTVAPGHPIFSELATVSDNVPWNLFPVFRNWHFSDLNDEAMVLMQLSDGSSPVVLASDRGRGQIVTITTPLPEVQRQDQPLWNELWVGDDPWPAFALLLGTLRTLSGSADAKYTFAAGEPVRLENPASEWPSRYDLFSPTAAVTRVDARDGALALGTFDQAGIYRMRGQLRVPVARGFSVNAPADATLLTRIGRERLDDILGEGNYSLAAQQREIESSVGQARFGRELYPLLMLFVAGLFLAEQAMSNRFYQIRFSRAGGG